MYDISRVNLIKTHKIIIFYLKTDFEESNFSVAHTFYLLVLVSCGNIQEQAAWEICFESIFSDSTIQIIYYDKLNVDLIKFIWIKIMNKTKTIYYEIFVI